MAWALIYSRQVERDLDDGGKRRCWCACVARFFTMQTRQLTAIIEREGVRRVEDDMFDVHVQRVEDA